MSRRMECTFVELAPITDPTLVVPMIANTPATEGGAGRSPHFHAQRAPEGQADPAGTGQLRASPTGRRRCREY